ncbi:MAG: phoB [Bacteroidota bacterium]|nr:phoB [Bacteroidota bacterium]
MGLQNKIIRILLIDDDEDDQYLFLQALREVDEQAICEGVLDGEAGLKKLKSAYILPDYIFLDLNMPKIDGMEVLKQIKETSGLKHVPVVMYSTSSSYHHLLQAKRLGAIEYVTKPTSIPELVKIIRYFVDNIPES